LRLGTLDLNLLIALEILIEERSVSAAAKRLHLSQPAMTGALNRLREFFADELLVQSGRQMTLTPKAEDLRQAVRDALHLIRTRIAKSGDFDPATAVRKFIIIASDFVFHVLLAQVMAQAATSAPGLTFDVSMADARSAETIERGSADLLITIGRYMSTIHPRIALFKDDHVIICWSKSAYRQGIDAAGFATARHVAASFGTDRFPTFTETWLAERRVTRHVVVRLPNSSSLPQGVIGTDRIAIMYRRHAAYFATFLPITLLEMPFAIPEVAEEVQWHRQRDQDQGLAWLIAALQHAALRLDP
jgi:LysR family nod box-dependent transcriptional activator